MFDRWKSGSLTKRGIRVDHLSLSLSAPPCNCMKTSRRPIPINRSSLSSSIRSLLREEKRERERVGRIAKGRLNREEIRTERGRFTFRDRIGG